MKAHIDQTGCLEIRPENEIEVYALDKWLADNFDDEKGFESPNIIIDTEILKDQDINECKIFYNVSRDTSATKCFFCGKEKHEH